MSIALDLALYLRDNKLSISMPIRGFLFTLMFRVGSNPYAWVSQEELADELNMTVDGVRKLVKKSAATGLIEIQKNSKDSRKNLYKPAEYLINYHQNRGAKTKNNRYKRTGNSEEYRYKCTGTTGTNVPVLNNTAPSEPADIKASKAGEVSLKEKESNMKSKGTREKVEKNSSGSKTEPVEKKAKSEEPPIVFTNQEKQEARERDIDIQKCYNRFRQYHKNGTRPQWEEWFKESFNGKKAVNKHLEKQLEEHEERKKREMGSRYVPPHLRDD